MLRNILAWAAGILLGVLYLYAIATAVGNLLGMLGLAGALGTGLSGAGWFWLVFGIVAPAAVLALALMLGRRRGAGRRILLLAAGVALVAVVQIDLMHVIPESSYFA